MKIGIKTDAYFSVDEYEQGFEKIKSHGYDCVENLPFRGIQTCQVDWVKKLLDYFQHPNLKMCFDTGHVNVYRDDLAGDVRKIGKYLQCLHVHDNRGDWDEHMIPYKGTIDWQAFLTALKEIGYQGCFSLETYSNKKMPEPFLENERINLARLARFMVSQLDE